MSGHEEPVRLRVLAFCGAFEPGFRAGGPIRSMAHIVDTLPGDVGLTLVTSDRDLGDVEPYTDLSGRWVHRGRARIHYLDRGDPRQWWRLSRTLRRARFDVLYLNSLLSPLFSLLPLLAARLGVFQVRTILLAPRGELSPGALAQKSRKKELFLGIWRRLVHGPDVLWQATSPIEAADIRCRFPSAQVLVNGNQTSLPSRAMPPDGDTPHARLVYVGRISPKKNLELSLRALRHVDRPVTFDIHGPAEDVEYWSRCRELIAALPRHVMVRHHGGLAPDEVRQVFAASDAFVFPTLGENFGHTIVESLSASCPVIASDATPWSDVLRAGGGRVLDELSEPALAAVLCDVTGSSAAARLAARRAAGQAYEAWWAGASAQRHLFDDVRRHAAFASPS